MKDHEKRELVSRITAVALAYRAAEQLRERIGEAVLPAIDAAVAAERERLLAELRTMHTQQHGRHNYYLYAAEMLAGNL